MMRHSTRRWVSKVLREMGRLFQQQPAATLQAKGGYREIYMRVPLPANPSPTPEELRFLTAFANLESFLINPTYLRYPDQYYTMYEEQIPTNLGGYIHVWFLFQNAPRTIPPDTRLRDGEVIEEGVK